MMLLKNKNWLALALISLLILSFCVASAAWIIKPDGRLAIASVLEVMMEDEDFKKILIDSIDKYGVIQKKKYSPASVLSFSDPWYLFEIFSGPEATKLLVKSSTTVMAEFTKEYQYAFRLFRISIIIALLATLCALIGALSSFWSQGGFVPKAEDDHADKIRTIVTDLRIRAANQRNQASLILLTIAGACCTSFLLFYTADDLISSRFDESMQALQESIVELNTEVGDFSYQIADAIDRLSMNVMGEETDPNTTTVVLELLNTFQSSSRFSELSSIPAQSMVVAQEGKNVILTTLIVRIGSITIAIFIVLMLAPAYQHATNLASFYDSRADSLSLANTADADQFRLITEQLDPPRHGPERKLSGLFKRYISKDSTQGEDH